MPLQETSGNVTTDAYGGGVAAVTNYIEDVFSTYLYTGNGTTLSINNGIDLSGKGGLTWFKERDLARDHVLEDTVRGAGNALFSNYPFAEASAFGGVQTYNANGFTLNGSASEVNNNANTYVSWTFRKQPKFFDIQIFTSNTSGAGTFSHLLGSSPGCVMIKDIQGTGSWLVYHQALGVNNFLYLDYTGAANPATSWITPSSTSVTVANGSLNPNSTYVAYLFAHNAGGFGLTGTDNVISCGSYTGTGSATGPIVNLGYEPQWVLIKKASGATSTNWFLFDSMRGMPVDAGDLALYPNLSNAEFSLTCISPLATGFQITSTADSFNTNTATYIYIAIRRGPMKVPTSGTSVFAPVARSGTGSSTALTSPNIVTDMAWIKQRDGYDNPIDATRLIGPTKILFQNSTSAEVTDAQSVTSFASNVGYTVGTGSRVNASGSTYANWVFKRAPSVFDVVCYTGDGTNGRQISHNLTVAPELMILKRRTVNDSWTVMPISASNNMFFNTTAAMASNGQYYFGDNTNAIQPTSTYFTVSDNPSVNNNTNTMVAYLFATCAGVSKVGSYTGTGTLTTINCGFTSGARFVMIKRTDSTGPWYIWDTARGMVSGTDPSLMINDSEIEVNANSVYTASTGFQLLASPSVDINTSGGTYIYLAIA